MEREFVAYLYFIEKERILGNATNATLLKPKN